MKPFFHITPCFPGSVQFGFTICATTKVIGFGIEIFVIVIGFGLRAV